MHEDQEFQQKAYLSKTDASWCTVTQKGAYKRWKQGNKTGKKSNNKVFVDEQQGGAVLLYVREQLECM